MTRRSAHHIAAGLPAQGLRPATLALAMAVAFGGVSVPAGANPTGGVAIHGQASMATSGNRLTVTTQNGAGSSHSAINWQSFSIPVGNVTVFQQPSAASTVINRVVTDNPSQIFGTLSSNGRVVVVNPSGIAIGAGAVIDTAGFTASALRMSDADAIAGRMRFGDPAANMGGAGGITVGGRVIAREGDVVLIAPNVDIGAGALIQAPNGSTILAAGQQVEITGRGLEGIRLVVQAPENQARNLGRLEGDAVAMFAGTLRHSGEIQATTATMEGGRILLKSSGDTYVAGAGKLTATGARGGQVDVLGQRVAVLDQAVVDASGAQGGGTIRVGGDFQGKNPDVPNATMTYLGAETQLKASATAQGDGGRVIVWADDVTRAHGRIAADGGPQGGAGGLVETSGKRYLDVGGSRVTASSVDGRAGTWLLDPADISVVHGANGANSNIAGSSPFQPVALASTSVITDGTLSAALDAQTNVVVSTTNSGSAGSALGNILFDASVNGSVVITRSVSSGFATLDLIANNSIDFIGGTTSFTQGGPAGSGMEINLSASSSAVQGSGILALDSLSGNSIGLVVKGGKTLSNFGNIGLNGASYIKLPNESGYATFANTGSGLLTINSTANWSFLSDSGVQGGLVSNAGGINVALPGSGSTSWEALYSQSPGGSLIIAPGKVVSAQNLGNVQGAVQMGAGSELRVSEAHGGLRTLAANFGLGQGKVTVVPGVSATMAPTGGSLAELDVQGSVVLSPGSTTNVATYTQATPGSSLTGSGNLTVTNLFNQTAGSFAPSGGTLDITHTGAGVLAFPYSLNLANLALTTNEGINQTGVLNLTGSALFSATGGIGGPITAGNITAGASVSLAAASNVNVTGPISAGAVFTASNTNSATPMLVRDQVDAGSMSINLNGGLRLEGLSSLVGAGLNSTGAGGQTITARYLEVLAVPGEGSAGIIASGGGNQTIVTTGDNGSSDSIRIADLGVAGGTAAIKAIGGGSQTITANNGSVVSLNAAVGEATIHSDGGQSITLQGTGANILVFGNALGAGKATIGNSGGSQSVTVGQPGQSGGITILGGSGAGQHRGISSDTGSQSIVTTGSIQIQAGTALGTAGAECQDGTMGACAGFAFDGPGAQFIRAQSIQLLGGSSGAYNRAIIVATHPSSTQTLQLDGGPLSVAGGGAGDNNLAAIHAGGTDQTIDMTGSAVQVSGGIGGTNNRGIIEATGAGSTQTFSGFPQFTLTGGNGGGTGVGNGARILSAGNQVLTVGGAGIVMTGGGGTGSDTDNDAQIYQYGLAGTGQTITVSGGTSITLTGGSSALQGVGGSGHGSRALIESDGDSQIIHFMAGGSLGLVGGTNGSRAYAIIEAKNGSQSITGGPNIALLGGASGGIAGEGNRAVITADTGSQVINAGSISITGGPGGQANSASIFAAGDQTVTASNGITLQGGNGGGLGVGNFATLITNGNQAITVGPGGLSLTGGGGTGGQTDNYAFVELGDGTVQRFGKVQTITVNGGGSISLQGGSSALANVGSGHGSRTLIESDGDAQNIVFTAGGDISLAGGTNGSRNYAVIDAVYGPQSITGAGNITLTGGASGGVAGEGMRAGISADASTQTIQASGAITLQGGALGVENRTFLFAAGNQSITASSLGVVGGGSGQQNRSVVSTNGDQSITTTSGITLLGGSGGGGSGVGNLASLTALGNQTLVVGNGGLTLSAGSGVGLDTDNAAFVLQGDNTVASPGKTQSITVNGGGNILLSGGSSQRVNVGGATHGSRAFIEADGDSQSITFNSGGSLVLNGGSAGSRAFASVYANFNASQSVTGASSIELYGGIGGGVAGEGNYAFLGTNAGAQTISVGSSGISLAGGGGIETSAEIRQSSSTSGGAFGQTINIGGGGAVTLQGGTGTSSFARIDSHGSAAQSLNFSGGGNIQLTGGTGPSLDFARIRANNGAQSIAGSPSILVQGGASGGAEPVGGNAQSNFAQIAAISGTQTIAANSIGIEAGAAGVVNFAVIQAPTQTITAAGNVHVTGGGSSNSLDGTIGAGARIGGAGSGPTNLTLSVGGDLTLTGGSLAGAAIGANLQGGSVSALDITVNGNFGLYPGSSPTAGARLGSPAANVAGGDITIHVPNGTFALNGVAPGETAVRTLGNVSIQANSIIVNNTIAANTIVGDAVLGVSLGGAASLTASAASGSSLILDGDVTAFSNTAGAGALNVQPGARWLVYSNDPLSDTVGGLPYDFKQYNASYNGGTSVLGSGNGLLYHAVPTVNAALVGPVSKVYNGTTAATLAAGNYSASLQTSGALTDVVTLNNPVSGTYDTKAVGSGKTVTVNGVAVSGVVDSLGKPVFGVAPAVGTVTGAVGDISGASITSITGLLANPKVYDGTTLATIGGVPTFVGMAAGDSLTFNYGTADFNNKNVGNGKPVTVNGVIVGGPDAGNYLSTPGTASAIGNITPASISSVTGITVNNKVYDGTTAATVNLGAGATFNGMVPGDALVLASANGAFVDKNASLTPKTVNISAITLGGVNASNYTLASNTSTTTANISQAQITAVTGVTANKVYDGNTTATPITSGATLVGMVPGDNLLIAAGATATYDTRHVGTGKTLNVLGLALTGADAGNYNLVSGTATGTGTITQLASVTWTGGGGNQLWSNAANWAGGALPDGYNVAAVVIPASAGTVNIDPAVGTFGITSLTSGSPVSQSGGALVTTSLALNTQGGLNLGNPSNLIGALSGANSGSGDLLVTSSGNMQLGPLVNTAGAIDVAVSGNLLVGGKLDANTTVGLSAAGTFYQNAAIIGPAGVSVSATTILPYGPVATTQGSPISYLANGLPVTPPPTALTPADPGPVPDPIPVFLDLFEKAASMDQSDTTGVLPGDARKKQVADAIVTEGDVCR